MSFMSKPGEEFETDVRDCQRTVEVAHDYLMIDEFDELNVIEKESRVLSLLQLVSRGLEEVVNNYHKRIKGKPESLKKVK